jgi:HAD superfamily hydrolase (TIGR01549 family)
MIKVVLFDYGGTLVRGKSPWVEVTAKGIAAVYGFLKKEGLEMGREQFLRVNDSIFKEYDEIEAREDRDLGDRVKYMALIQALFSRLSQRRRSDLASKASDKFWEVAIRNYPLRKNARKCLEELESAGLPMVVISNHDNYDSLVKHLEQLGILPHFLTVLASEKEGVRKPNPAIFLKCLEAVRATKEEAVFVGDSMEHDIAGAKATGITSVLIDEDSNSEEGPEAPDYMIRDLSELPAIIASLRRVGQSR